MSVFDLSGAPAGLVNRLIHYLRPEAWNFQNGTKPMVPTTVLNYVHDDLPCPVYFHSTYCASSDPAEVLETVLDGQGGVRVIKHQAPSPSNVESTFDFVYGVLRGMTKTDSATTLRLDVMIPNLLLDEFDIWVWRPDPSARKQEWNDIRFILNELKCRKVIDTTGYCSGYHFGEKGPVFVPLFFEVESLDIYLSISSCAWGARMLKGRRLGSVNWLKDIVIPHAKALLEIPDGAGLCTSRYWNHQLSSNELFTRCNSTWYMNPKSIVCGGGVGHDPEWYVDWAKTKQVIEMSPNLYPTEKEVYDIHPKSILSSLGKRIPSEINLWTTEVDCGKRVAFKDWVRPFEADLAKLVTNKGDADHVVTVLSDLLRALVTVRVTGTPDVYEVYPRFRHCLDKKVDVYVTLLPSDAVVAATTEPTEPTEPAVAEPTEPAVTEPTEPAVTESTEPTEPTEPVVTEPTLSDEAVS